MRYGLEAAALLTKKAGPTKTRFSPGKLGTLGNGTSALSVAKAATYATSENQHFRDKAMSAFAQLPSESCLSVPTNYCRSAVRCVENPVVNTTVRKTGDFGRQPLDRRKIPSPAPIGDNRVFSDTS